MAEADQGPNARLLHRLQVNVIEQLRDNNPPSTIVFLGDGNSTFSTAFEKRSNELDFRPIIASTELYPSKQGMLRLDATAMGDNPKDLEEKLNEQRRGKDPVRRPIALFFQCPCVNKKAEEEQEGKSEEGVGEEENIMEEEKMRVRDLVAGFFESASQVQEPNEYLIIGICTLPTYIEIYGNLQNLAETNGYEPLWKSTKFTQEMKDKGYKHTSNSDTPLNFVYKCCATIGFQRKHLSQEEKERRMTAEFATL